MRIRKLLDCRKLLIYSHPWLGIAVGAVFVAWCISGVILMYAGVPHLTAGERLMRLPPLDLSTIRVTPAEATAAFKDPPRRLRISMQGDQDRSTKPSASIAPTAGATTAFTVSTSRSCIAIARCGTSSRSRCWSVLACRVSRASCPHFSGWRDTHAGYSRNSATTSCRPFSAAIDAGVKSN
ncbi:MAG TPA: hypothetical protein VIR54_23005 [Vicinamibacterales bacterium]